MRIVQARLPGRDSSRMFEPTDAGSGPPTAGEPGKLTATPSVSLAETRVRTCETDTGDRLRALFWIAIGLSIPSTLVPYVLGSHNDGTLLAGLIVDGIVLGILTVLYRSQREADARARHSERTLERLSTNFEQFAYIAHHDLKEPLRGITDLVEFLEEDLDKVLTDAEVRPEVERNLERIRQQARRMKRLMEGVISYATATHEQQGASGPPPTCECLLRTAAVEAAIAPQQLMFRGDFRFPSRFPAHLAVVFRHLLENAALHHDAPETLRVTVDIEQSAEFDRFTVRDNGPGIEPKYFLQIFEIFRTLKCRDEHDRVGVGLAIAKKYVEAHGGTIEVRSDPGEGASFTFDWPAASRPAGASLSWRAER